MQNQMRISISILFLILISINAYSQESQWTGRGEYSELKAGESAIVYLKATTDGKAFFTQSADTLRKWDIESGEMIEEKYLEGIRYGACTVSDDEKYYAFATGDYLCVNVFRYDNDSMLYTIYPFEKYPDSYTHNDGRKAMIKFHQNPNEIIIGTQYEQWCGGRTSQKGNLNRHQLNNGTPIWLNIIPQGINSMGFAPTVNMMAFSFSSSFEYSSGGTYRSGSDQGIAIYTLTDYNTTRLSKYVNDTLTDVFYTRCWDFTNDSKYITACVDNNEIITWDTQNGNLEDSYYLYGSTISRIKYSDEQNYLLATTKKWPVLFICDPKNKTIIDTIKFEGSFEISNIIQTNASTVMISCSDGYVRKISPSILQSNLKAFFATQYNYYETGDSVGFNNYSTGKVKGSHWQFGDGYESYETNPVHHYKTAGEFTASLIVNDGKQYDTLSRIITVKDKLIPEFSCNYTSGHMLQEIHFYNKSEGDIEEWLWDFGDGTTSNEQNPVHTYNIADTFTVKLTISNSRFANTIAKEELLLIHRPEIYSIQYEREFDYLFADQFGISGYESSEDDYIISVYLDDRTSLYIEDHDEMYWYSKGAEIQKMNYAGDITWEYSKVLEVILGMLLDDNTVALLNTSVNNSLLFGYRHISVLDENGMTIDNTSPGEISDTDVQDVIIANSGGFLTYGRGISSDKYSYLTKLNSDYSIEWTTKFIKPSEGPYGYAHARLCCLNNGCYALTATDYGSEMTKIYLIGASGERQDTLVISDTNAFRPTGIFELPDESFIVTGYGEIDGSYHGIAKRIDIDGNEMWRYESEENTYWLDMVRLNDDYFAVTGNLNGYTGYVILDNEGSVIENKKFGYRPGYFNSVTKTSDGGLFLVGNIYNTNIQNKDIDTNVYVVRTKGNNKYMTTVTEINSNNTFSLFPNPANNKLTIQCPLPDAPKATLSLYNSLGRPVRNYTITNGSNTIDISSLAPGIYLVKLLVNDEVYSNKFIKTE